jgi:predicted acylesterase/phospholipase RssA
LTTGSHGNISLYNAVATSASIPSMFPPQPVEFEGQRCDFTDGGLSDALPISFAKSSDLNASTCDLHSTARRSFGHLEIH